MNYVNRALLIIGMAGGIFFGGICWQLAKSVMHEILAINGFLIAAVCFVGFAIIEAIEKGAKPPKVK